MQNRNGHPKDVQQDDARLVQRLRNRDVVGESGSMDEMFLEFLARFDQGLVTDVKGQKFEELGMVRSRGRSRR